MDSTDDLVIEDGMTFVMRAGTQPRGMGEDLKRPEVLEVSQLWGDALLDTRHFGTVEPQPVRIGARIGHRWEVLGVDMGHVPRPLHKVLPYTPPLWSEVHEERLDDFFVDLEPHQLFVFEDGRYVAQIPAGWDGFLDHGDARYDLEQAVDAGLATRDGHGFSIPMVNIRLGLEIGEISWFAQMVPSAQALSTREQPVEWPIVGISSAMLGMAGLFALAMFYLPAPAHITVAELPDHFNPIAFMPNEPPPEVQPKAKNEQAAAAQKREMTEGVAGKRDAPDKLAKDAAKTEKRRLDVQVATEAGLLGALSDLGLNSGDFANSGVPSDLFDSVGGLIGAKGSQIGGGGLGSVGNGLGQGGTIDGMGGLNRVGGGGIPGNGLAHGGTKPTGGHLDIANPIILGSLNRSLIDAVIKRHKTSIKYCYQRQLTQKPNLAGKVTIKFVIAGDGSVSSANVGASSLKNAAVESCIVGRFQRMKFPTPKGGGIVVVRYPFLFAPG